MPHVHLVIGPVGAGKSTFVRQFCRERVAVPLTLDEWMAGLFRPDRPEADLVKWYAERAERCVDQIWRVAGAVLATGVDVILEIGLIQRQPRRAFCDRVLASGADLVVHWIDAPRSIRRERVAQRNRDRGETFSADVPPSIFELASDLWEPPQPDECEEYGIAPPAL
ncbi:MAG: ATP-binding protein [Myxococcales bacterium FL481]|nr:MAG: ATP-binding protein [Myxococcales bacterium FL481]